MSNATVEKLASFCVDLAFCLRYRSITAFNETTILQFIIVVIFSFATPLINGLYILMIYKQVHLRSTSNFLFFNIALVNITFGFSSLITCSIYYKALVDCTINVCYYRNVYVHISGTGMALTMTTFIVISIERYICIFHALRWNQIITHRRVVVVLATLWLFWIGTSTFFRATDSWKFFQILFMVHAVASTIVIFVTNFVIFREIRRHERMIEQEQQVAPNAEEIKKQREKRRAKTIILTTALVLICYLPSLVLLIGYRVPNLDQVSWQYAWLVSRTIFLSHAAFDIVVYGLRTEETRKGIKNLLRELCCME